MILARSASDALATTSATVDADDTGSGDIEDRPAVTAGPKGGIDIDAAVAGAQHLDRLAAEDGDMSPAGRIHAPAPGGIRARNRKLDANGPIAPQISALRRAFGPETPFPVKKPILVKARRGMMADPARPPSHPLISRWNLLGCHGISSVKEGLGRPPNRFGSSSLSNGS